MYTVVWMDNEQNCIDNCLGSALYIFFYMALYILLKWFRINMRRIINLKVKKKQKNIFLKDLNCWKHFNCNISCQQESFWICGPISYVLCNAWRHSINHCLFTWMEAETIWPEWSKSRVVSCPYLLALVFRMDLLFPKASINVEIALSLSPKQRNFL